MNIFFGFHDTLYDSATTRLEYQVKGSTALRLQSHYEETVCFFATKFPEIPGTHLINLERMKDSRPWSHPVVLNMEPLDWESSALTTQSTSNDRELTGGH